MRLGCRSERTQAATLLYRVPSEEFISVGLTGDGTALVTATGSKLIADDTVFLGYSGNRIWPGNSNCVVVQGRVWRTLTFLGAVHRDRRIAPCAFDGPINRQCFCALAQARGIVDMGNLGSDKSAVIRNAVRVTGARLCFLHPIYPTLNQIDRAECINYLEHTGYVSVKKTEAC